MTGRGGGATVFLSAGEPSGDQHAASVARQLRTERPQIRLVGLGGRRMRAAGVELLADLDTLAVMGFTEVVRRLPSLLRLRWRVRRFLAEEEVDLLVPVDYPGFNLPLACYADGRGIPVLYYIAPQVWAWRRSRARKLARCARMICVVLPFEKDFFESYGADARFVGHPLLDEEPAAPAAERSAVESAPILGLFPGSRAQEVERILPPFLEAARRLRARRAGLRAWVARSEDLPRSCYPETGEGIELRPVDEVLRGSRAALTKSGTVTLQLALHGVPMVVGHRMSPLTHWLARRLVTVERIALVNLVADEEIVPELIQGDATPERLARKVGPLLDPESDERDRVVRRLAKIGGRLGDPGCARRVARTALDLLG